MEVLWRGERAWREVRCALADFCTTWILVVIEIWFIQEQRQKDSLKMEGQLHSADLLKYFSLEGQSSQVASWTPQNEPSAHQSNYRASKSSRGHSRRVSQSQLALLLDVCGKRWVSISERRGWQIPGNAHWPTQRCLDSTGFCLAMMNRGSSLRREEKRHGAELMTCRRSQVL